MPDQTPRLLIIVRKTIDAAPWQRHLRLQREMSWTPFPCYRGTLPGNAQTQLVITGEGAARSAAATSWLLGRLLPEPDDISNEPPLCGLPILLLRTGSMPGSPADRNAKGCEALKIQDQATGQTWFPDPSVPTGLQPAELWTSLGTQTSMPQGVWIDDQAAAIADAASCFLAPQQMLFWLNAEPQLLLPLIEQRLHDLMPDSRTPRLAWRDAFAHAANQLGWSVSVRQELWRLLLAAADADRPVTTDHWEAFRMQISTASEPPSKACGRQLAAELKQSLQRIAGWSGAPENT